MSNLNQDIIKDYKNKVSKLSSELNNRDQECLKLKEQIIFLQKENMELKLNSRSASHVGSYSMLNSQDNNNETPDNHYKMYRSKYDNESETTNHTARSYTTNSKQRNGIKYQAVGDDTDDSDYNYSQSRTQQANSRYNDRTDRHKT